MKNSSEIVIITGCQSYVHTLFPRGCEWKTLEKDWRLLMDNFLKHLSRLYQAVDATDLSELMKKEQFELELTTFADCLSAALPDGDSVTIKSDNEGGRVEMKIYPTSKKTVSLEVWIEEKCRQEGIDSDDVIVAFTHAIRQHFPEAVIGEQPLTTDDFEFLWTQVAATE